jgi:hypothetical protein
VLARGADAPALSDRAARRSACPILSRMPRRPRIAALTAMAVSAIAPAGASAASTPTANPPGTVAVSNETTTTRWAHTADVQPVFSRPTGSARQVARLRLLT